MRQADRIVEAVRASLSQWNPSVDTSPGGALDTQVLGVLRGLLGSDPLTTPAETFLRERLRQDYPDTAAGPADALTDVLLRPVQALMEPMQREVALTSKALYPTDPASSSLEAAEALASNYFLTRKSGTSTTGIVRVFFASPTGVVVLPSARFYTADGKMFLPLTTQTFPMETVAAQQSGSEYYVDVAIVAEKAGLGYDARAGGINTVRGIPSATRCANLASFVPGEEDESAPQLLSRIPLALTERSLTTRRGIQTRISSEFPSIRAVEVTGKGDPEMTRDVLTGGGGGAARASGLAFLVGTAAVLFSLWEQRGEDGEGRVQEGDTIDLNFWPFLYSPGQGADHSRHTIATVLLDSRTIVAANAPSVLLVVLDRAPDMAVPTRPGIPGVLPGVPFVVECPGVLQVGGLPGGILEPRNAVGFDVDDGGVHLGGHADVWVRPSTVDTGSAEMPALRSPDAVTEGHGLVTNGGGARGLSNQVHLPVELAYTVGSGSIRPGEMLRGRTSGARATVISKTSTAFTVYEMTGAFVSGETVDGGDTGAYATLTGVSSTAWADVGVEEGHVLSILSGPDTGTYTILRVQGALAWLSHDLTHLGTGLPYRVLAEGRVALFRPRSGLVPFGTYRATDLRTTVGSAEVRVGENLQTYGVQAGDTLEILTGVCAGTYRVRGFSATLGGYAPVLDVLLGGTTSGNSYAVYREGAAVQRPLVRIPPGGVHLLGANGEDTGVTVPYAHPVELRALSGFSGARAGGTGVAGFVLPDPGPTWSPTEARVGDPEEYEGVRTCYSDDCTPAEGGYIAVCTLLSDGSFFLSANLPDAAASLVENIRAFLLALDETFGFGSAFTQLVQGVMPVRFGEPDTSVESIMLQYEVLLPYALFDGHQNTFVALPEFDWAALFAEAEEAEDAIAAFRTGLSGVSPPALSSAQPGNVLTISSGANAGSYRIERVDRYALATLGSIVDGAGDLSRAYEVTFVTIQGEFPAAVVGGLAEFFSAGGIEEMPALPTPPSFPGAATAADGTAQSPWNWIGTSLTWLLQWLNSLGFDLPTTWEVDTGGLLTAVWELLFSSYTWEAPTGPQRVRAYFVEPTSLTVYQSAPPIRWGWDAPAPIGAVATGAWITLPLAELAGTTARLWVNGEERAAVLDEAAGEVATLEALAELLTEALDPLNLLVVFSGPDAASGQLVLTSASAAEEMVIEVQAASLDDAFLNLGFSSAGTSAQMEALAEGDPTTGFLTLISLDPATPAGVKILVRKGGVSWSQSYDLADAAGTAGDYSLVEVVDLLMEAAATDLGVQASGYTVVGSVSDAGRAVFTLTPTSSSDITSFEVTTPSGMVDIAHLIVGATLPAVSTGTAPVVLTGLEPVGVVAIPTLSYATSGGEAGAGAIDIDLTYPEAAALYRAVATALEDDDSTGIAAYLNGLQQTRVETGEEDVLGWWFGGAGRPLGFRTRSYGLGAALDATVSGNLLSSLGWSDDIHLEGTPGDGTARAESVWEATADTSATLLPHAATEAWGTESTSLLRYSCVTSPEDDETFVVFPGRAASSTTEALSLADLPRDLVVEATYENARSIGLRFTDSTLPAPLLAGVRAGDLLQLYEQKCTLLPVPESGAYDALDDMMHIVLTRIGSTEVLLPTFSSPPGTFLAPAGDFAAVAAGDLFVIEEGDSVGSYTVISVQAASLILDRPLPASTAQMYRCGQSASILTTGVLRIPVAAGSFSLGDIGKFLLVWGSSYEDVAGSYAITGVERVGTGEVAVWEVTTSIGEVDHAESGLLWAVIRPPSTAPTASTIGNRTALYGGAPYRIYSGTPTEWRVADVSPHVARLSARVRVALNTSDLTRLPTPGIRAPYRIIRPYVQYISATQMREQRDRGLFYADIWMQSLGGTSQHNLPPESRLEAVRGTYASEGYAYEVEDTRYTFSDAEQADLVLTTHLLPIGLDAQAGNYMRLEGHRIRVQYEHSLVCSQVQQTLRGPTDRPLCASLLLRRFLPAYVYLDIPYTDGGSTTAVAEALRKYIDGLGSLDTLQVSRIESVLQRMGITQYAHPLLLATVTHDLDRNLVGSRSSSGIGDVDVPYNGTDRITSYIAGPDYSRYTDDTSTPAGERVRLGRSVSPLR